jgi:hypothetical protein
MAGNTIQLAWGGEYVRDGPWQAIRVGVGSITDRYNNSIGASAAMMWPDC